MLITKLRKIFRLFLPLIPLTLSLTITSPASASSLCETLLLPKKTTDFSEIVHLENKKVLSLMTFNALNLSYTVDSHRQNQRSLWHSMEKRKKHKKSLQKPEWAINEVAQIILEKSPDILSLQEVESRQSAINFVKYKLHNQYEVLSSSGNDRRGIQIMYLVKKNLLPHFDFTVKSFINEMWTDPKRAGSPPRILFSRDLLTLEARAKDAYPTTKPLWVIFSTHLKSKRDRKGDPQSERLRQAQINRTVKIIHQYIRKYDENLVYFEMGDHNSSSNFEAGWSTFYRHSYLANALDYSSKSIGRAARVTHTYHPGKGKINRYQELDSIFISKNSLDLLIDSQVIPYKYPDALPKPFARSREERNTQASDHRPVIIELDFQKLLNKF